MHDLKFGVVLGDLTMSASECIRLGPKVENWGYDSIWMADHLIDIDGAVADPYTVFGYLAARTQNVLRQMHCVGTVEQVIAYFDTQIQAGVRHFLINPAASPDVDATLEAFSTQVMSQLVRHSL